MIGLVRALTLVATMAFAFSLNTALAADKTFKRDELNDQAIRLENQIKSEAGPVAKAAPQLKADASFRDAGMSPQDAMLQAGRRRLRPIAMTALATVAGMLPLALGIGAGAQMLQPLAISVIGGLLSSMVFSLVFTPAIHFEMQHRAAANSN